MSATMTTADLLAVMDRNIEQTEQTMRLRMHPATGGGNLPRNDDLREARAAVAALVAEREAFKREAAVQLEEMEGMHELIVRQGDLLTGVVNAIRGEPAELCRHSHHDAPELAAGVVAERDALREVAVIAGRIRLTDWLNAGGTVEQQDYCAALAGAGHE